MNKGQFVAHEMMSNKTIGAQVLFDKMIAAGYTTTLPSIQSAMSRFRKGGMTSVSATTNVNGATLENTYQPPSFVSGLKIDRSAGSATEKINGENYTQRYKTIKDRYNSFDAFAENVAKGFFPSLIVSGPPGLGKSYTIRKVIDRLGLEEEGKVSYISGTIRGPGLYIQLWEQRDGGLIVLDDSDDIFRDETALNLLKTVLDSKDKRVVSYHKLANFLEKLDIPTSFEFKGSIIFCTNIDMEQEMNKSNILSPHFGALIDRSLYLHLAMRNQYDYFVRVNQVIEDGLFNDIQLSKESIKEIVKFVKENLEDFYILSLRLVYYIGVMKKMRPKTWKTDVRTTKMRTITL